MLYFSRCLSSPQGAGSTSVMTETLCEIYFRGDFLYHFSNYEKDFSTRTCTPKDIDFILGVYEKTLFYQVREFYEVDLKTFHERFYSDYFEIEIIEKNHNLVGFYQIGDDNKIIHIKRFFLHPDYHKKGIGKNLLSSMILWAKENQRETIKLMVWENNPAYFFYKSFGFQEVEKQNHKFLLHLPLK